MWRVPPIGPFSLGGRSEAIEPGIQTALATLRASGRQRLSLSPQLLRADAPRRRNLTGVTDEPTLETRRVHLRMKLEGQNVTIQ